MEEIEIYNLQNESVQVDGNFAILRSGTIDFSVKLAGGGIVSSMMSMIICIIGILFLGHQQFWCLH